MTIQEYQKLWYLKNKSYMKEYKRLWYLQNRKKVLSKNAEWVKNNKDRIRKHRRVREKFLYKNNPVFRFKFIVGKRIRDKMHTFISGGNPKPNITGLPYTMHEFIAHLQKQFTKNMTWKNYGKYWEIDHIIPVSHFSFTSVDDEDFKQCWALENLRPLTCKDNHKKRDGNKRDNQGHKPWQWLV